jgi:hypothetical protein
MTWRPTLDEKLLLRVLLKRLSYWKNSYFYDRQRNQGIERSPRRLLVTGGAGFIGSNFVHHWCSSYPGDRVVVLDALTYAGNRQTLATLEGGENFRFVQGDICDRTLVDTLLKEENINTVAHLPQNPTLTGQLSGLQPLFKQTLSEPSHF